nr:immunoglobulin heavy chain junction region [Macaca mulatta]
CARGYSNYLGNSLDVW